MSQREKENTINKLRQFFRSVKSSGGAYRDKTDTELLRELEAVLQPQIPVAQRCKALKELCESDKITRLEDATIKKLWELTKDLIVSNKPTEQRHIAFTFYQKLIQSQYEGLSIMREKFFNVILNHNEPEDINDRMDLLKTLTDNGKNITNFEETIGEFMLKWIPAVFSANITQPFFEILINIIIYNSGHLDDNVVAGIIEHACSISCSMEDTRTVLQCLQLLDAILCYYSIPPETLTFCIVTLCRTVNKEVYCQTSWKIMKNMLGTTSGHAALLTMCNILNDPASYKDEALLRGAVFYINMGLWGTTGSVVPMLKCSPSPVLLSFFRVLRCQRIIVTYEVILGIQRLINTSGKELTEPSWDLLCDILKAIADNILYYEKNNILPRDRIIQNAFQETITKIEAMLQRNEVATNPDKIYNVIEYVCENRSEASVIQLIEYKATKIVPTQPQWLLVLNDFMNRFFGMDNIKIRITAIQVLNKIMDANRAAYEEEILERIVIPLFSNINQEPEPNVRTCVGMLLLDFSCHCETKRSLELLDIVEKLLNRPFDKFNEENKIILKSDDELKFVSTLVDELIKAFRIKLYRLPSSHAIKIFYLLIGHLEKYYQKMPLLETSALIRLKIFVWLLNLRANSTYHIGYPEDRTNGSIKFSYYLTIESDWTANTATPQTQQSVATTGAATVNHPTDQEQQRLTVEGIHSEQPNASTATNGVTPDSKRCNTRLDMVLHQNFIDHDVRAAMKQTLSSSSVSTAATTTTATPSSETVSSVSIRRACKILIDCLKMERDWSIMQFVLKELPNVLQNKAVLKGTDMDSLATTLINLYLMKNPIDAFLNGKPSISDYYALVLPTIAGLIPHHQYLRPQTQTHIIESLRLCSRHPRVCVHALTVALLEMPEIMLRHLPDILLEMSKMSTTLNVAVPVLEFLSTLNRLPSRRFANFIMVQYMYVFAISIPYTNPHKYDHYTVSLAHHVIAGWFLKCRLPLRRNFVNYIIKGFETNVQMPFDEVKKVDFSAVNEDSSNRKRSSSLTEQGTKNRERPSLQHLRFKSDEAAVYNFHMELAETCIDFLARHTFSPCSALPKRLPTADFLLAGGQALTWLVGHNLITITTSGCSSTPIRNGLCDRCSLLCKPPVLNHMQTGMTGGMTTTTTATATAGTLKCNNINGNNNGSTSSNGATSPETLSTKVSDSDGSMNKRYTKASFQHNSGRDSDSTEFTCSTSSSAAPTPYPLPNDQAGKFFRQPSNEGRFSNSSGSLEALSRRSSNPDAPDNLDGKRGGGDTTTTNSNQYVNQPNIERTRQTCACSCTGWAEIYIRRPTGNMSWIMRIQNQIITDPGSNEFPLHDLISIFMPTLGGIYNSDVFDDTKLLTNRFSATNRSANADTFRTDMTGDDQRTGSSGSGLNVIDDSKELDRKEVQEQSQEEDEEDNDDEDMDVNGDNEQEDLLEVEVENETATATITGETLTNLPSGPINIPKMVDKHKIPSGSFSDVEPDDLDDDDEQRNDDVTFEENDTRSRNPVRRVNSSPEMSSNWRNTYTKGPLTLASTISAGGPNVATNNNVTNQIDDDINTTNGGDDSQQKKKNFGKDMRVSCEAIPEEIADSTPPNPSAAEFAKMMKHDNEQKPSIQALDSGKPQQSHLDFVLNKPNLQSIFLPPASLPLSKHLAITTSDLPLTTTHNQPPKKQHSADDALNTSQNKSTSEQSSSSGSGKTKPTLEMTKLTTKPPQSPTPLSPRLLVKNSGSTLSVGANINDFPRGRSKTISVVRGGEMDNRGENSKWPYRGTRSGISPSSLFLQLYHTGSNKNVDRPIQIKQTKAVELFDLIPPFETHKIGVLYVGPGQCNNETEILRNRYGSFRYVEFLQNLGSLVALKHAKEMNIFVDMETDGRDGNFTYIWQDDIIQVTFHVATLMPNKDHDPNCNEKKKNIGNDFVSIVYNESGEEYNLNTIKGQFNYACVIVQPLELNSNRIFIKCKDDVSQFICHTEPKIISDASAPLFARQLALHANMASLVAQSLKTKNQSPYASNWLERLRRIKHLRAKVLSENSSGQNLSSDSTNSGNEKESQWNKEDFTQYTQ